MGLAPVAPTHKGLVTASNSCPSDASSSDWAKLAKVPPAQPIDWQASLCRLHLLAAGTGRLAGRAVTTLAKSKSGMQSPRRSRKTLRTGRNLSPRTLRRKPGACHDFASDVRPTLFRLK